MTRSRQLAAIMFTDIVGYTALMQQNEEKAIEARDKHRRIFNSVTEKHRGRILQYYGDGTLSIFDSAIDAVKCGTEMQIGFREDPAIPVRIGIHTGDIIFSDEEIIGDGVNVASRIESLAVPGSVFISDKVYDEIKNQESIQTSMLKTFKLKNVEKPIEVYAISNVGLIVPRSDEIKSTTERDLSAGHEQPERSEPEPILATKLYIPPSRPKVVTRQRLIGRLNEGSFRKLSLISAPPGFGKTTLASEWAAASEQKVAWLSLDESDRDPARFLAYIIAAIRTIEPNIGENALSLLQSPQPQPEASILAALINDISSISDHFTLVLDDYHIIDDKPVSGVVTFLIEHLPAQMHLIITTREEPQLPLPRLRVRGQLTELRIADLRFTASEAAEFLNHVMGLNISARNISVLEASTEGWVAGLQLAALSMQGKEDIAGFVKAFSGDDRYVVDYLVEEVLQNQTGPVRSFLLQTSILDRLSGSLCDAITGQSEGKSQLESLERGNLFVFPLDDKRKWYRYHHLFSEVLLSRLMEEQPDQVPLLHRRASEWYQQHNLPEHAISHALSAEDFNRAADLIEFAWPAMNRSCQDATWLGWIKALPEEMVDNRPVLCHGYGWSLLICGEMEASQVRLDRAERLLEERPVMTEGQNDSSTRMIVVDEEQFRTLPASIANARAYRAQALGDVNGTLKFSRQALDLLPEDDYLKRAVPAAMVGFMQWESGDLEAAYRSFSDLKKSFIKGNDINYLGFTFLPADIKLVQGQLLEAANIYEQALQHALNQGEPKPFGIQDLYRGIGEIYHERGDPETAGEYLQTSLELNEQTNSMDWQYRLCLARSRFEWAAGDLEAALDLLHEAEALYVRNPMPDLRPVAALKTRVWIDQGRLDEALAWVQKQDLSPDDDISYLREFEYITLARVLIASYKKKREARSIQDAIELLERLLKAADEGGRQGSVIEILVLQALAHEANGNINQGLPSLEHALALAEPEGYVRIFLDEGINMANLLTEAAAQEIMPEYTGKLLAMFEAGKLKP